MSAASINTNNSSDHTKTKTTKTTKTSGKTQDHKQRCGTAELDITKEEFQRISDALKKEEFRKLFLDYVEEIQDPENRKRYEEEIKQIEAERGVEVVFINPEPGFVIKTSVGGTVKCFINVAKSPEIAKPSSEGCVDHSTGSRGLSWSIPMAQAAPRDDLDGRGKRCRVYDVIFHPDALYLAQRNKTFHKCLVNTALDAVEREHRVSLDRVNLKFPKLQFKGIARPTVIRKLAKNPPAEASEPHPLESIYPAKPTAEAGKPKVLPTKLVQNKITEPEYSTPKYTVKHRRDVDLSEYTNELDAKLNMTLPRELVVEIELPLLNSSAECHLDVTGRSLYLLSDRAGAKYRLTLDLPYAVNDKEGCARFDTNTRRLIVTLPVVQQSVKEQREMRDTLLHLNREDSGVESDIREDGNSNNGESPVEELPERYTSAITEKAAEGNTDSAASTPTHQTEHSVNAEPFLKANVTYQFPGKFTCNVLDNIMSVVLHVRNVRPDSLRMQQQTKQLHLQFISVGGGYYPTHYAFFIQLPYDEANVVISSADVEAWENNVVLNLHLSSNCEHIQSYAAGLDASNLKTYNVQEKFRVVHNSRQQKQSSAHGSPTASTFDVSVERSEHEDSVEIDIKSHAAEQCVNALNNTEDEESTLCAESHVQSQGQRKANKKQKRKNKKRRSFSESACDDIKAYREQQKQEETLNLHKTATVGESDDRDNQDNDDSSPERVGPRTNSKTPATVSSSVDVPTGSGSVTNQQRKQRSFSESRDSFVSSSAGSGSCKGILKHYSRYDPRPSISDSCSSIDECSSYSGPVNIVNGTNSLRFSQSFSDIPEENVGSLDLSESCKKSVRFSDVIKKQIFRLDSSILGQRKKNQKRRDLKQRALQRRLSESDSVDYEDHKPLSLLQSSVNERFFKGKTNQANNNSDNKKSNDEDDNYGRSTKSNKACGNADSESSSDGDTNKNTMMFEMDM